MLVLLGQVPDLRTVRRFTAAALVCGAAVISLNRVTAIDEQDVDWPVYRGDPKGNQYAALAQIHAANVHKLQPVWEYRTRDANQRSTMHANPVVVNGVMYVTTPSLKAVALDAATGRELWVFDPAKHNNGNVVRLRNRGVAYWKGVEGERIFHFVKDRVYAVDAKTGAWIAPFGKSGFIDLRQDLGVDPASAVIEMTSPGAVFRNFLIIASRVNETLRRLSRPYPRIRHGLGRAQVDLPYHSTRRSARTRDVEVGEGRELRRSQRLGWRDDRRAARLGVCRHRVGDG